MRLTITCDTKSILLCMTVTPGHEMGTATHPGLDQWSWFEEWHCWRPTFGRIDLSNLPYPGLAIAEAVDPWWRFP